MHSHCLLPVSISTVISFAFALPMVKDIPCSVHMPSMSSHSRCQQILPIVSHSNQTNSLSVSSSTLNALLCLHHLGTLFLTSNQPNSCKKCSFSLCCCLAKQGRKQQPTIRAEWTISDKPNNDTNTKVKMRL
jgi:hypothetical protein